MFVCVLINIKRALEKKKQKKKQQQENNNKNHNKATVS